MRWAILLVALLAVGTTWSSAWGADRLALNDASAAELEALDAVDGALAAAVVALRRARGELRSVEELRVLPGMTEEALHSLRSGTWVDVQVLAIPERAFRTAGDVLSEFAHEPDVLVVQAWAAEQAQVRPEAVRAWLRASRTFALLPQVRAEYRLKDDWKNDFRVYDLHGNPPVMDDETNSQVLTGAGIGQDRTVLVRATWDLDKLVMSSEQIRVINEAQDVVKLREKVLGEVTRLYFERRRHQVDMLLDPKPELMGRVRDELRLHELGAALDAYTAGRFSAALAARAPR